METAVNGSVTWKWNSLPHGPVTWNSLPHDLQSTDISLNTFKKRLKAFLFDSDICICNLCEFGLYE